MGINQQYFTRKLMILKLVQKYHHPWSMHGENPIKKFLIKIIFHVNNNLLINQSLMMTLQKFVMKMIFYQIFTIGCSWHDVHSGALEESHFLTLIMNDDHKSFVTFLCFYEPCFGVKETPPTVSNWSQDLFGNLLSFQFKELHLP